MRSAMEFPTDDARKKYLEEHPGADPAHHTVAPQRNRPAPKEDAPSEKRTAPPSKEDEPVEKEKSPETWVQTKLRSLIEKVPGVRKSIADTFHKAPAEVQQMFVDKEHRQKALATVAQSVKGAPKALASKVAKSAKAELHELKHAVHAAKKLFKRPPGPFDKADKQALYSAGAYAASAALAAFPPGTALIAAGALGKSFALHVGVKSVSHLLDQGFLHFEWAETLLHGAHHVLAADGGNAEPAELTDEQLMEGLIRVVAEVLEKGIPDDEIQTILTGKDSEDTEMKEASLRAAIIRLATAEPSLRRHLVPVLRKTAAERIRLHSTGFKVIYPDPHGQTYDSWLISDRNPRQVAGLAGQALVEWGQFHPSGVDSGAIVDFVDQYVSTKTNGRWTTVRWNVKSYPD